MDCVFAHRYFSNPKSDTKRVSRELLRHQRGIHMSANVERGNVAECLERRI